ncbi:orc1/cdc6 family replication initiation protein [Antrihabitans sp. YC3-6]|uniref:Orc1/cdc6 family replication initiation protein n=1 Tax=Antrihabitans stalagmiti TaxID=2799499 RepID=A0A934NTW3_9NOCA|nr:NB-ARC domain-containing protein [Antrihabitans stalagmiti]MBJ8341217.1 orc1/cdc6 family replication initiation protein [Antrihabitans stalagmiti]
MAYGGGVVSAFGYHYQYLATIEYFLEYMRANLSELSGIRFFVETSSVSTSDKDKVDFSTTIADLLVEAVQVKASIDPTAKIYLPPTTTVFDDMTSEVGAVPQRFLTNRAMASTVEDECKLIEKSGEVSTYAFVPRVNATITIDKRSLNEIRDSILGMIVQFRGDRHLGLGQSSARYILASMLDLVFRAGSGLEKQEISALELIAVMHVSDHELAHVGGEFDWGNAATSVPYRPSPFPREDELDYLSGLLGKCNEGRTPQLAILAGTTGMGKSVLASDFCHSSRNFYETVYWIDCANQRKIDATVTDILRDMNQTDSYASRDELYSTFNRTLSASAGPWILVFDGVDTPSTIKSLMPTTGTGVVVVTTPNSTRWTALGEVRRIGPFASEQAINCFAHYAGISAGDAKGIRHTIADIVEKLGRMPMAVAMAGLYFRNSGDSFESLASDYFKSLAALEDEISAPPELDRTIAASVALAIRKLNADLGIVSPRWSRPARHFMNMASFMNHADIPLNMLVPTAMRELVQLDLAKVPEPAIADSEIVNGIVTALRTQTLVERNVVSGERTARNWIVDTVTVPRVVNDIVRLRYLRDAPPWAIVGIGCELMFDLYGWAAYARTRGDKLPMEIACQHGESVIANLAGQVADWSDVPEDARVFYLLARAMLRSEISARFARKDSFDFSTDQLDASLDELEELRTIDLPLSSAMSMGPL